MRGPALSDKAFVANAVADAVLATLAEARSPAWWVWLAYQLPPL